MIREHYRLAEELYGAERCLPDMRKFGIKYSQLHPQHDEVRDDFCSVASRAPGAMCWRSGTRPTAPACIRPWTNRIRARLSAVALAS